FRAFFNLIELRQDFLDTVLSLGVRVVGKAFQERSDRRADFDELFKRRVALAEIGGAQIADPAVNPDEDFRMALQARRKPPQRSHGNMQSAELRFDLNFL